jgi:hypothetical protein
MGELIDRNGRPLVLPCNVKTPDGPGYAVALDEEGRVLVELDSDPSTPEGYEAHELTAIDPDGYARSVGRC